MARQKHDILSFFLGLQILLPLLIPSGSNAQLLPINVDDDQLGPSHDTYIVEVEKHERHELLGDEELESWHLSFLPNSTLDSGESRLVYSYRHVLSGFAARLTPSELDAVKSKPGFLHADRDQHLPLATTYTPRYLGLSNATKWGGTMMGNGTIIGVLDTGIKATHPSFNDTGMPRPIWNGSCAYKGFHCNKKIIGAKAFRGGANPSPEDEEGHGTHVAGTAAGNFVKDANVLGMAKGDPASGTAPMAHLAIYRVCFPKILCAKTNQYAGMDQAIKDGVDIISMSIGGFHNDPLYKDVIARGAMAAMQHGILTVAVAGNDGPVAATLAHSAPWVLIVGSSTTDRRIVSIVELGDGKKFVGQSSYQPMTFNSSRLRPLAYQSKPFNASCCVPNTLSKLNLTGKIVLCKDAVVKNDEKARAAIAAGAEGMIIINLAQRGRTTKSAANLLPTSHVNYDDGVKILNYYLSKGRNATATIRFNGTRFGFMPSPAVASSSSRGPSRMNGGIIKPDVLAPGVNILAAWPKSVGPNPDPLATHTFNFDSGTSMATPHVSGIAALVRSKHRTWSPSEIISAFVTTANDSWTAAGDLMVDEHSNHTAGPYTMGAGQVSPAKAIDPGLLYGLTLDDYVGYLCGLGYNDSEVTRAVGSMRTCMGVKHLTASELNYPSIAVNITRLVKNQKVNRTATNVGGKREDYRANITEPAGVKIHLSTSKLHFTSDREQKSYEITFNATGYSGPWSDVIRRGKIVWYSDKHVVTNPIAVRFT